MIEFTSSIIRVAYEIFNFINTIEWIYFSNTSIEFTINNIVIICFKFSSLSIIKQFIFTNTTYSIEWIVDRIRFRKNIRSFVIATEAYRNSQSYLDWINDQFTTFISVSKNTISTIFLTTSLSHSLERLDRRSQVISSSSFSQRRDSTIATSNLTSRNTESTESISEFTAEMSDENNNWQNTEFFQQQWQALQTLIEDIRNNAQSKSQNSIEFSDSAKSFENANNVKWNSSKMKFFDSWYEDKNVIIDNFIEHVDKNIYFRDVHLYIEKIKNMLIFKKIELIRHNFYNCMREHALQ